MFSQLTTSQSRRKLSDYQTIVAKKRRLKEEMGDTKPQLQSWKAKVQVDTNVGERIKLYFSYLDKVSVWDFLSRENAPNTLL